MFGCTGSCHVKPPGDSVGRCGRSWESGDNRAGSADSIWSHEAVPGVSSSAGSEAGETRKPAEPLGSGR